MAYNRAGALEYLNGEFGSLAREVALSTLDSANGWKGTLDRAMASPTTDDGQLALLDYWALTRLVREFSTRVSIQKTDANGSMVRKERQQAFGMVKALFADAKERVSDMGLLPEKEWQFGSIEEDTIEPNTFNY